jgi:hypothetical protein
LRQPLDHIYTQPYSGAIILGHFSFSGIYTDAINIDRYIHIHSTPQKPIYLLPLSPYTGIFSSIFAKYITTSPHFANQNSTKNTYSNPYSEIKNIVYPQDTSPNISQLRHTSPYVSEILSHTDIYVDIPHILTSYTSEYIDMSIYSHSIVIFDYSDTYTSDFRYIVAENTVVFGFSEHIPLYLPQSSIYVQLSMLPIHIFQYMLYNCDMCIVRGETSIQYAVSLGVPFLWDMYKSLG